MTEQRTASTKQVDLLDDPSTATPNVLHPLERLRLRLQGKILDTVGRPDSFDEYRLPKGDRGFFGPDSVAWIVHSDLPSMLIGGISALMLQTLHPLAMAGIAEHSNYREDPLGRLHRTARFVAGTTYGPTALAEQLIETVKAVHCRVVGTAPDGKPYSADDPALLTWVHITEVSSFLRSYERFGPKNLTAADKDRYFDEVSILAYRLGATDVPRSVDEVTKYFLAIKNDLVVTDNARFAVSFLRTPGSDELGQKLAHRAIVAESIQLLPPFARRMLGIRSLPVWSGTTAALGALIIARIFRWAMGPSRIAGLAKSRGLDNVTRQAEIGSNIA